MQSSSEQPLVGEERYVTPLITAAKETMRMMASAFPLQWKKKTGPSELDHHCTFDPCLHILICTLEKAVVPEEGWFG